ncbi:MAG TPA: DMT family transporter [Planctomycetes bacterium]|nr:DMT family transporter [Planctomycetota bacterium]
MGGTAFALLSVLGMAAFTLVLRAALETWPVGLAGVFSRVVTLAALGTWVLARGQGWRRLRPRGTLTWLALMGVVSVLINLLLFGSLKWTTATNNALLFRLDVVFVVLIGWVLGIERPGWRQLALLPLMLAGVALVGEVDRMDWAGHLPGDLMVVGAAFAFAANAFVIRHILRRMDEEAVALVNHGLSTFGFLGLAVGGGEFARMPLAGARPSAWMCLGLLGLVAAVVLPLYYAALRRMAVWKLRAWLLLTPVVVAGLEWAIWGVRPGGGQCVGAALILAGLAGLVRAEWQSAAKGRAGVLRSPAEDDRPSTRVRETQEGPSR